MEHVLSIPELIDRIFAYTSRKTNTVTALVCRGWLELSRDHIWSNVRRPKELLSFLAPLNGLEGDDLDFIRIPLEEDWQRFEPFATRVRRITFTELNFSISMGSTLLRSASRPNPIFPNLRHVFWHIFSPSDSRNGVHALFLHPGVPKMTLYGLSRYGMNWERYPLRSLFSDVAQLAPNITQLHLRPHFPQVDDMSEPINELLSALLSLRRLAIEPSLLTASVLQLLSTHSELEAIVPAFDEYPGISGDPQNVASVVGPLDLQPGAFPALKILHLSMTSQAAIRFIADPNAPSARLEDLRIRLLDPINNVRVRELLMSTAEFCSNLRVLTVFLYPPVFASRWDAEQVMESLTFHAIEPLCRLKTVEQLAIYHVIPTSMTEPELFHFVDSLPRLSSLHLVPRPDWGAGDPRQPGPSNFDWHTLEVLLRRFPRLTHLGVYLDLSLPPTGISDAIAASLNTTTADLPSCTIRVLTMGTTPIPPSMDPSMIASKLAALLGNQAELWWGINAESEWGVPLPLYGGPSFQSELQGWEEIQKLLYSGFGVQREGVYHVGMKDS
ncbi:unnamed protein product [Peniophora sp. CBMAI 1063]|nr:unnamed protein product [Peniophora sp. CBMAI 1063]